MKSYYIHFICHGNIDETHKGKYIGCLLYTSDAADE